MNAKDDPRWHTAIHEAGHVVMAQLSDIEIFGATIEPADGDLGQASYANLTASDYADIECDPDEGWKVAVPRIMTSLAGACPKAPGVRAARALTVRERRSAGRQWRRTHQPDRSR